jgi:ubiquinone/menaquinone biosynthesis C-methylase UbiE
MSGTTVDFGAITARQQETWAKGDFHEVARQVVWVSELLVQTLDPRPGQRVLDVACGSGNAALAAARRYCDVSGIDYVPALIERAKVRAAAENVPIDFRVADAQALPYADATFDAVTSVFGVMFAPDQAKAAAEIVRVTKPGGKVGLACWMPEGMVHEFFAVTAKVAPPPPGVPPSHRWGTEEGLRELFGPALRDLKMQRRTFHQQFRSGEHALEIFRKYFGPTVRAFEVVGPAGEAALSAEYMNLYAKYNRATDGSYAGEAVYLESILTLA